jgi:cbb3-type cytochrome oxidase subunit 3
MNEQSFKNHGRYVPLWHFITPLIMVILLIGSIINFIHADAHNHFTSALIVVIVLLLFVFYWYSRAFALRAQDRAIRAEENFRYFILTGKPFDNRLRMRQIIAIRFASDEEMPGLVKRAIDENLSQKQIKEAIKNWRADHHRA